MTNAQVAEISAAVLLDYPQPLCTADAYRATDRILAIIRARPDYNRETEHFAILFDNAVIDVRVFATEQLAQTWLERSVGELQKKRVREAMRT